METLAHLVLLLYVLISLAIGAKAADDPSNSEHPTTAFFIYAALWVVVLVGNWASHVLGLETKWQAGKGRDGLRH